jgi:hypothetical protein
MAHQLMTQKDHRRQLSVFSFRLPSFVFRLPSAIRLLPFAFCLFMLTACSLGQSNYITQQQTVDGITIAIERPQEAELLKDYELIVTLTNAGNQPVENAQVYFDLTMRTMPMDLNQPIADPLGNGRYGARAVFAMEGDWDIIVYATVDGTEHVAEFDLRVLPP